MRRSVILGIVGIMLVAASAIGCVVDRIHWAGIPEMAFAQPWQGPAMFGLLSVVSVLAGFIGMLLIGIWIGEASARRRRR
ncbi:hypothetical protein [Agromyces sp. NPDC058064]|uniref:hypothetical protein n=1 Tax=Agromyces sp. NPDC058064 TaxID=3346322 RepID=UPI0036DE719D